ncbi:MAG TPA: hypothetical protein VHQ21_15820 [Rhodanobacteraceae bacterium]|jgi:hypothetical protein|nr:hypothetical protein [Rhodanobacteraceae bacterium]
MKIDNLDLAFALGDLADEIATAKNIRTDAVRAFAQYIADHPTSSAQYPTALELLDLDDVPAEAWGQPMPDQAEGERRVADSVQRLNSEYARSPLHAMVALRRLAWDAQQLARRLAEISKAAHAQRINGNGKSTAGLILTQPLHDDFVREDYRNLLGRKPRSNKPTTGTQ